MKLASSIALVALLLCEFFLLSGGGILSGGTDSETEASDGDEPQLSAMLGCAQRLWRCSGSADPAAALLCGSAHPAQLLGQDNKGRLDAGADADLVLLDPSTLRPRACFVGGRLSYADPKLHGALWFHN